MFIIETETLDRCWQVHQQFENTIKLRKNKKNMCAAKWTEVDLSKQRKD